MANTLESPETQRLLHDAGKRETLTAKALANVFDIYRPELGDLPGRLQVRYDEYVFARDYAKSLWKEVFAQRAKERSEETSE